MERYYKCTVLVHVDDSDWSESADETFSVCRVLDVTAARELVHYEEITGGVYNATSRILTEEGGI